MVTQIVPSPLGELAVRQEGSSRRVRLPTGQEGNRSFICINDDVLKANSALADELEDAFKTLEHKRTPPSLREAHDAFAASLILFRDKVVMDVLQHNLAGLDDAKLGKPTAWGSEWDFVKPSSSGGVSARMSSSGDTPEVPLIPGEMMQTQYHDAIGAPVELPLLMPGAPPPPPSDTTVRRFVRRVKLPRTMQIDDRVQAVLDALIHKVVGSSIAPQEVEQALESTMDSDVVFNSSVIRMVYHAGKDSAKGEEISSTLGLDGSPVSKTSSLVAYMRTIGVRI